MQINQSESSTTMKTDELLSAPAKLDETTGVAVTLRKLWAVTQKELQAEWRTKEIWGTMTSFSILSVIILGLAFDLRVPNATMVVPGVLWAVILFAGTLGLHRSFGSEVDRGSLAALLLAPVDRSVIYFGKVLANLLFMLAVEILLLPLILIIFDVNLFHGWIMTGMLLGTIGYVCVGTFFAALTANTRTRETLMPIMLLPVMVPIFVAGVGLTANILDGRVFNDFRHWLGILGTYDVIFMTVAYLVFDLIWEDAG